MLARVSVALLLLAAPRVAWAGGLVGEAAEGRVTQERALVVWDHVSGVEHLFLEATARGVQGAAAYLFQAPAGASTAPALPGVIEGFSALAPGPDAPDPGGPGAALLAAAEGGLEALCKAQKLLCSGAPLVWADLALKTGHEVILLPTGPARQGVARTGLAHLRFVSPHPVVPFAEPADPAGAEPEPPAPGPEHPPRVRVWVELGNETPSGKWERQMDAAGEAQGEALAACYTRALDRNRKLAGDVHVQVRIGGDDVASDEGERADRPSLSPVSRCFAAALAKAKWPKNPFQKPIRFEVHASLRPPAAVPRSMLVLVLSSLDAEPKLGDPDDPHEIPGHELVRSFEPSPEQLREAFSSPTRGALGLDPSRRWRLIVFRSSAEVHSARQDIWLRPLAPPPPPRPGETPLPVVDRGDQPDPPAINPSPVRPLAWLLLGLLCAAVGWGVSRLRKPPASG